MGYTTITVRRETWKLLAKMKGDSGWDEFLDRLARARTRRLNEILRELGRDLDEESVAPVSEW